MKTIFSNKEIAVLRQNICVLSCTDRSIVYTYEFRKRVLELHAQGVSSKEIWRRNDFDIGKWNTDYCRNTIKNWKRTVKKKGFEGLQKLRETSAVSRSKIKRLTHADQIKRLELKIKYLEAENTFLAQLRAKRAESNSGQKKSSKS